MRRRIFTGLAAVAIACGGTQLDVGTSRQSVDEAGAPAPVERDAIANVADASELDVTTRPNPSALCFKATKFHEDLETDAGNVWDAQTPTTATVDDESPISGTRSFRFDIDADGGPPAYVDLVEESGQFAGVCAFDLTFTIRANAALVNGESTPVARIDLAEPPRKLWLLLQSGQLMVFQELDTPDAIAGAAGPELGAVAADTPTVVKLRVDALLQKFSSAIAPASEPLPALTEHELLTNEHVVVEPRGIPRIVLGQAPGVSFASTGTLWIDDITLE